MTMNIDTLQVGSKLAPLEGGKVGFGVLLGFQQHQTLGTLYVVMTDFGNTFKFTKDEILDLYSNELYLDYIGFAVDDLEKRFSHQIENLKSVLDDVRSGKYQTTVTL